MSAFLKSKFTAVLLVCVLIFVMIMTAKIVIQRQKIESEISSLQKQADKIKNDNTQLSYLLKYFTTQDYQEKEAREKLNLVKEGEQVVILPSPDSVEVAVAGANTKVANYKLWFNYFFNNEN